MKQPLPVHVGQRNVKTALSASLCALIYYFLGRNPAFACIGAIFGMGADMEHSRLHGGNRLFGTIIGGLLGIALGVAGTLIAGQLILRAVILPDLPMSAGAFLFSVAMGVGFGMYPAAKASKLQPVVALRAD